MSDSVAGYQAHMAKPVDTMKVVSLAGLDETIYGRLVAVRLAAERQTFQLGTWLNDIFSPTGGEPTGMASIEEIDAYWDHHVAPSSMNFVVIHEADFINRHPQAEQVWKLLRQKSHR